MRLLTHNFLQSNVKGTTKGYPLKIEATKIIVEESPMDSELVLKTLPKLKYPAIVTAWMEIKDQVESELKSTSESKSKPIPEIPTELPPSSTSDDIDTSTLEALYFVLFNIHVIEGNLICPDTGRKFPIIQGIPNMILHEDEI